MYKFILLYSCHSLVLSLFFYCLDWWKYVSKLIGWCWSNILCRNSPRNMQAVGRSQKLKSLKLHESNMNESWMKYNPTWYPNRFSGNLSSFSSVNLRFASSRLSPPWLVRLLLELTLVDALDAVAFTDWNEKCNLTLAMSPTYHSNSSLPIHLLTIIPT